MDDRKSVLSPAEVTYGVDAGDFEGLIAAPVAAPAKLDSASADGVVVGTLVGFSDNGSTPLVTFPGQPGVAPVPARATIDLHGSHIGREAVLVFEGGDRSRPIVIGCVRQPTTEPIAKGAHGVEVEADGERLVVSAQHGLVLRCGKASITLSPDGKVVLRGTQVVSHASGLNRIRGGSVQLN